MYVGRVQARIFSLGGSELGPNFMSRCFVAMVQINFQFAQLPTALIMVILKTQHPLAWFSPLNGSEWLRIVFLVL